MHRLTHHGGLHRATRVDDDEEHRGHSPELGASCHEELLSLQKTLRVGRVKVTANRATWLRAIDGANPRRRL
jgi:hypothetical protein